MSATSTVRGSGKQADSAPRILKIAGTLLVVVGLVMAAMPFVGALIGVAFDGYDAWAWNQNRFLLHVLPGAVGAGLGALLLVAHRSRVDTGSYPSWLGAAAVAAFIVGIWNGSGPWLLDLMLPASEEGLMFLGIPGFDSFGTAHQLALEAFCHWVPGILFLAVGALAYQLARALPVRHSVARAA